MKLVYLTPHLKSPAGMERVLHNKICWLSRHKGYEITIITTEQGRCPIYFDFPMSVQIVDMEINYSEAYNYPCISRICAIRKKRKTHFDKLSKLLLQIRPDVTITLYPSDAIDVSTIKDGSKKVLEFHSNRYFRLNQGYTGVHRWVAKYKIWKDYRFVKKFDSVVVLSKEGALQWKNMTNIIVIPNAVTSSPEITVNLDTNRVIAVGRLIYEKGFDRLIEAWRLLPNDILLEWKLDIYGEGEERDRLNGLINSYGLGSSIRINAPTKNIFEEYAKSAFIVTTSRSEGFGMVLIEAMSCGLPAVCFDYSCGPKEVVSDGINGFLVENGNIHALSKKMEELMRNRYLRFNFSKAARSVRDVFSEDRIMKMWAEYFARLTDSKPKE